MSARDVPLPLPAPAGPERLPLLIDRARFRLGEVRAVAEQLEAGRGRASPAQLRRLVAAAEAARADADLILERVERLGAPKRAAAHG